jgi:hypothetical protein
MLTGGGAFLPLATGDHKWHENGLIQDEQNQQHESRHDGTSEQEGHAGRHEERPEPEVKAEPER